MQRSKENLSRFGNPPCDGELDTNRPAWTSEKTFDKTRVEADEWRPHFMIVACPTCKKRGAWFETGFGPFCSKRCKWVDLGKWLNEEHAIREELKPHHFAGYENLPAGDYLDVPEPPIDPRKNHEPS